MLVTELKASRIPVLAALEQGQLHLAESMAHGNHIERRLELEQDRSQARASYEIHQAMLAPPVVQVPLAAVEPLVAHIALYHLAVQR